MTVPADPAYGAVVRSVVTGLAALADPGLDALEDVRLATGEAFAFLSSGASDPSLSVDIDVEPIDGALEVTMRVDRPETLGSAIGTLAYRVLRVLATDLDIVDDAQSRRVILRLPLRNGS